MELTAGEIVAALSKVDPKSRVRIKVTHDLDCEVVSDGVVIGTAVAGRGQNKRIILDCTDDGHGYKKFK